MTSDDILRDLRGLVIEFEGRASLFEEDSTAQRVAQQCADDVQEVFDNHAE